MESLKKLIGQLNCNNCSPINLLHGPELAVTIFIWISFSIVALRLKYCCWIYDVDTETIKLSQFLFFWRLRTLLPILYASKKLIVTILWQINSIKSQQEWRQNTFFPCFRIHQDSYTWDMQDYTRFPMFFIAMPQFHLLLLWGITIKLLSTL